MISDTGLSCLAIVMIVICLVGASWVYNKLASQAIEIERLKAEISKLQAKTCQTCRHYWQHNWNEASCAKGQPVCGYQKEFPNFGCNRWESEDGRQRT